MLRLSEAKGMASLPNSGGKTLGRNSEVSQKSGGPAGKSLLASAKPASAFLGSSSSLRAQKSSAVAGPKPFLASASAEQKKERAFLKKSTPTHYPGIKPK